MFDFGIGATELMLIAVVALIVVGPKDLPRLMRWVGNAVSKVRALAREFQGHLDEAMRETGIDEVKKSVSGMKEYTVADLDEEFEKLEKEFRDTALPDSRTSEDLADVSDERASDEDLLDETEREILSLDEETAPTPEEAVRDAGDTPASSTVTRATAEDAHADEGGKGS